MAHASEILDQLRASRISYVEAPVTIVYTNYSIAKGQTASNAFDILIDLFFGKLLE